MFVFNLQKHLIMTAQADSSKEAESSHQELQHEATLFAEPIFRFKNFTITNSFLNSFLVVILLSTFFILVGRKISKVPKGIQNFFEIILEGALKFSDSITGSRKKSEMFLPLVLGLFFFILINNWLGIFPGVGTIGFIEEYNGHKVMIPLFRGGTADLNTTLALAGFSVFIIHLVGVFSVGVWEYLNRFINLKAFIEIFENFSRDKMIAFVNPMKAFVGIIEIIGELAKVASLSFRLFGNIFAGEVLIASMMTLFAFFLPIPFLFLEVLVGLIQALIFSILVLVFLTMSTAHQEH